MFNIFQKKSSGLKKVSKCSKEDIYVENDSNDSNESMVTFESDNLKKSIESWIEREFHKSSITTVLSNLDIKLPVTLFSSNEEDDFDGLLFHCLDSNGILYNITLSYSYVLRQITGSNLTYRYEYFSWFDEINFFRLSQFIYNINNVVIHMYINLFCTHRFEIELKGSDVMFDSLLSIRTNFDSIRKPSVISLISAQNEVLQLLLKYDYSNLDSYTLYSLLYKIYSKSDLELANFKLLYDGPLKKESYFCEYYLSSFIESVNVCEKYYGEYCISSLGDWSCVFYDSNLPVTKISHNSDDGYKFDMRVENSKLDNTIPLKNILDATVKQISKVQCKMGWNKDK